MRVVWQNIVWYIQKELANGYEPDKDGFYSFSRKDIVNGIAGSASFFDSYKDKAIDFLANNMKMIKSAKFTEDVEENLFTDVSYEKGKIRFKKNPIYCDPKYSFLWAMPPLNDWFAYDCFDDEHRRRWHGDEVKFGAFPWSWSEEQIQNAKTT